METRCIFDWISFTVAVNEWSGKSTVSSWLGANLSLICSKVPEFEAFLISAHLDWALGGGRSGFAFSYRCRGVTIWMNPKTPYALIEISGVGCDLLRTHGSVIGLLSQVDPTRIDIAFDVRAEITPTEIVSSFMSGNKMRSRSSVISDTGETVYIGSKKSDRYLRVYRYSHPHPRAELLRFEFVCRRAYANQVKELVQGGSSVREIASSLALSFQIDYPAFAMADTGVRVPGIRGNSNQNKTERWLLKQCIPALKRLVEEGYIESIEVWVAEHIFDAK